MIESSPKLTVVTPKLTSSSNQYLKLLWASVKPHGIKIDQLDWTQSVLGMIRASKKGDICHFHWVHELSDFKSQNRLRVIKSIVSSLLKLGILKTKGYRLVWSVHNTLSHESSAPKLEKTFRKCLSQLCDDILVMSEHSRQEFDQLYQRTNRVHIVPHGNYIGIYPNETQRQDARQALNIQPAHKVMLHLGRLMPYKGIQELIQSFNQLTESNVVLLIAGDCKDTTLRKNIEQATEENPNILFHSGFLPDEKLQLYINAADWVVFPFKKILNSGSVMLALSFGKPVIVRQNGSISDLIQNGVQGFCYEEDDELISTLHQGLNTCSKDWNEMSIAAMNLAKAYDWSDIGLQLCQIYQNSLNRTLD